MHAANVTALLRRTVQRLDLDDTSVIRQDLQHCIDQADLWVTYGRAMFDERFARKLLYEEGD